MVSNKLKLDEDDHKEADDYGNSEFPTEDENDSTDCKSTDSEEFEAQMSFDIDEIDMSEVFFENEIEIEHKVKKIKNCEESKDDDIEIIGMEFPESDALKDISLLFPLEELKERIFSIRQMLTGECIDKMIPLLKNEKFDMISFQHILFRKHICPFEKTNLVMKIFKLLEDLKRLNIGVLYILTVSVAHL